MTRPESSPSSPVADPVVHRTEDPSSTVTEDGLWDEDELAAAAYAGDPLRPDMTTPTPVNVIARLTRPQREQRVRWLMQQSKDILTGAVEAHGGNRTLVAVAVLFSGGNDSTVLAHLVHSMGLATHAIHANTTIGIEQTRQFVRDTCEAWGLPLIEETAPVSYEELVIERGFPGPGMHWKMFTRLKERCLDAARHRLGVANSRTKYVLYVAGRRRDESQRRVNVPLYERDGSVVWASPIALWTSLDLTTYRLMFDVPINEVTRLIHMSGECLCGAFAKPDELEEIRFWFPEVAEWIDALEVKVAAAGHPEAICKWGHGKGVPSQKTGRLCTSCDAPEGGQTVAFTTTKDAA